MGNTSSSKDRASDDTVDFGYLVPQGGIYPSATRDWNQAIVAQLIVHRKLAPFYRPLEDYGEDWDDEQILGSQKRPPQQNGTSASDDAGASSTNSATTGASNTGTAGGPGSDSGVPPPLPTYSHSHAPHLQSASSALRHAAGKSASRSNHANKDPPRNLEAQLYRGAVDCPICFLYYPPNINQTRCCDQAICTECFVHIKRADPTTTHLVSEPACCPYCMQPNFGVTYVPPIWRHGIGAESGNNPRPEFFTHSSSGSNAASVSEMGVSEGKRRRRSISHTSRDVVTIDQIRPDWEAKLNAVRAAVARRANRRIVMRQVGDQLIPVGITSGRVVALPPGSEGGMVIDEGSASRRRRRAERSGNNPDIHQLLGQMTMGGQDIEELMIMEAMRLSMVDENERIRRQQEQERQPATSGSTNTGEASGAPQTPSSAASSDSQQPPQMSSSYRPYVTERLHEEAPQVSSSLPNSTLIPPNIPPPPFTAGSHPHRQSFGPSDQPPPSPSALGGAAASVALAFGAPNVHSQSGLVRESPGAPRTYTPLAPQTSALSAMLGATNTAAAILGGRGSPRPDQLPAGRPSLRTPSPASQAQAPPNTVLTTPIPTPVPVPVPVPVPAFDTHGPPIPVRHSPVASGAVTPTATSAPTSAPLPSHQDLPTITTSSEADAQFQFEDTAVARPLIRPTLTQQSQLSLLTPGSINSETAEGYDFLPSSPHSSEESEIIAHTPLIQEQDGRVDEAEERRSEETASDYGIGDGEPVRARDTAGTPSPTRN